MDNTTLLIVIAAVVVLIIVAVAAVLISRQRRSARLRSEFGPEYSRTVGDAGGRRAAEAELDERKKRVHSYELHPLSASDRDAFVDTWRKVQAEFVDNPRGAVARADELLTNIMAVRGYPMADFEQRSADLSVDHPEVVQNYRAGHEIAIKPAEGQAGTEDLRQAMIHYRALFDELVERPQVQAQAS
jgi:hypothetical protein